MSLLDSVFILEQQCASYGMNAYAHGLGPNLKIVETFVRYAHEHPRVFLVFQAEGMRVYARQIGLGRAELDCAVRAAVAGARIARACGSPQGTAISWPASGSSEPRDDGPPRPDDCLG